MLCVSVGYCCFCCWIWVNCSLDKVSFCLVRGSCRRWMGNLVSWILVCVFRWVRWIYWLIFVMLIWWCSSRLMWFSVSVCVRCCSVSCCLVMVYRVMFV